MVSPPASERFTGLSFLVPLLACVGLFAALPVARTLWTSLHRDVTFLTPRFLGAGNYAALLRDEGFWDALRFTGLFVLASVPLEIALGLAVALFLHRPVPGRGLLRAVLLIPWAIPAAVSGRLFELAYDYQSGAASLLWQRLGGGAPIHWLGSPAAAFSCLVAADVWKSTPFVAILLLAGLAAIPPDLHRQAAVDGGRPGQLFARVTLPLLWPVLVVALLFRTIDAARIFDLVYVLTGGGPGGATTPLSLYAYRFFLAGDFGYGSAVSVLLFLLTLALALLLAWRVRLPEPR